MFLPLFVLATSAELVASDIKGNRKATGSGIRSRLSSGAKCFYVRKCQAGQGTSRQCEVFQSMPNDKVEDVVEAIKTISDAEVKIYVGARDQKRIMPFISLVDEQNLAGKFWSVKIIKRGGKHNKVHGPAETIKWAIENGRVKFIGSFLGGLDLTKDHAGENDPARLIKETFESMRAQVSSGHLNIIVCPEFFFNNLYYRSGEKGTLLDNTVVESILAEHRRCFGRVSNVISVLSFLHVFHKNEIPKWLNNWKKPKWSRSEKKARVFRKRYL